MRPPSRASDCLEHAAACDLAAVQTPDADTKRTFFFAAEQWRWIAYLRKNLEREYRGY